MTPEELAAKLLKALEGTDSQGGVVSGDINRVVVDGEFDLVDVAKRILSDSANMKGREE